MESGIDLMCASKLRHLNVAAAVIVYNPTVDVVSNIKTYSDQVDITYVVDNSERPDENLLRDMGRIAHMVHISNFENVGIATALNIACREALKDGYDFILTMDQDSLAAPGMVAKMLEGLAGEDLLRVGMISPFHRTKAGRKPPVEPCTEVMTPMTSGCLLNLAVYRDAGPFRDNFFIDFVDNEYCLRLRKLGFRVVQVNSALLEHSVGDIRKFGPFIATNHSPVRRYYKARNRLLVFRDYFSYFPGHCLFDMVRLTKEIASIILFEQEKTEKLRMMAKGCRDFLRGKFGKYQD